MEGSESDRGHSRLDQIQGAQQGIDNWQVQQANAGKEASLANFKEFMAQHGHPNLSPEELAKLYAQFQEWNRHIRMQRLDVRMQRLDVTPA